MITGKPGGWMTWGGYSNSLSPKKVVTETPKIGPKPSHLSSNWKFGHTPSEVERILANSKKTK